MMRKAARVEMTQVTIQPTLMSLERNLEKRTHPLQRYAMIAFGSSHPHSKPQCLPFCIMQAIHCEDIEQRAFT